MKKILNGGKLKLIQRTNTGVFRKNQNIDLSFKISPSERNNPFTILPEKIYSDFNRMSYKRHTLTFPIKVPIWYRVVPGQKEYFRYVREQPNIANYAHLTGNQLLLTLLRYSELDQQEFSEVFFHLSIHPESRALDLEDNVLIKEATKYFIARSDGWKMEPLTRTVFSMYTLKFKSEALWNKMRRILIEKIYAYEHISSTHFAEMFIMFVDKFGNTITSSEIELLKDQLPRYLKKMRSNLFVRMFELSLDLKLWTSHKDYLFDRHFFMAFWKRPNLFNVADAPKILKGLRRISFYEYDIDFYEKEFLPQVVKNAMYCNDNKALHDLYSEIEEHKKFNINSVFLDKSLNVIAQRLAYVEKKLQIISQAEFIEIVKSDLRKFKELKISTEQNHF